MQKRRKEFANGRYFVEVQYREDADHVCDLKIAVVVHDVKTGANLCRIDNSHAMDEGIWPPHSHTDGGRHYLWTSSMQEACPLYLLATVLNFSLKQIREGCSLGAMELVELARAMVELVAEISSEEGWE